ncbi:MAG: hypothetical protein NTW08_08010 [Gammaproteobacteria bacterium]|nr:hypothetical protein [Gammaproteobacteria bacterium]
MKSSIADKPINITELSLQRCITPIVLASKQVSPELSNETMANQLCEAQEYLVLNFGCVLCIQQWEANDGVFVVLADMDTHHLLAMDCQTDQRAYPSADRVVIGSDAYRFRFILCEVMQRFGFVSCAELYWWYRFPTGHHL